MVNALTLDNAIAHFLHRQSTEGITALVQGGGYLWHSLSGMERFQANLFRHEVAEALAEINAFMVLGAVQRVRPDIAQVLGGPAGLTWLDRQLVDLRARFAG